MDDLIRIKGGSGETPALQDREIAYNKSDKALYIGTPDGNVRLCGADDIEALHKLIDALGERLTALESK